MKKILLIQGPNLNLVGVREPGIYGTMDINEINKRTQQYAATLDMECDVYMSNHEGEIIDKLHEAREKYDGVIINAGAYTHYSYAIHDAIEAIKIPVVEVHISNIHKRDEFRHKSVISSACAGGIYGFGWKSYLLCVQSLAYMFED